MLAIVMASMVPALALLSWAIRRRTPTAHVKQGGTVRSIPLSGWNARGLLLLVANGSGESYEVKLGLLRIGREQDNDIQLLHKTMHCYHAIVERTPEAEFYILDVSGSVENGMRIDGEQLERARLRDGKLIELGRERLRFQLVSATDQ